MGGRLTVVLGLAVYLVLVLVEGNTCLVWVRLNLIVSSAEGQYLSVLV